MPENDANEIESKLNELDQTRFPDRIKFLRQEVDNAYFGEGAMSVELHTCMTLMIDLIEALGFVVGLQNAAIRVIAHRLNLKTSMEKN
jgi:hypothetical protein